MATASTQSATSPQLKGRSLLRTSQAAKPSSNRSARNSEPRSIQGRFENGARTPSSTPIFDSGPELADEGVRAPLSRKRAAMPGVRVGGWPAGWVEAGGGLPPFIKWPRPRPNADFEAGLFTLVRYSRRHGIHGSSRGNEALISCDCQLFRASLPRLLRALTPAP